ncbi:MAG TPA: glycosyltransferase family 4 protein [Solirubrobacteraceae bacterium]|nr:glycosyltransferase family 4 protein [Solirubrobacteraceae bacterium]
MRILIFHGYLLSGTGSNVYNARLAEALVGLGHEVHLFSQDRHPERYAFVGAAGDWDSGRLRVGAIGEGPSPGCTVYRPDIGGLLPLYVKDRYEGIEAKTFADCSDEEIARYVQANVDAVREVAELVRPEAALANHLVMGPVILARALGKQTPYAVKVHGSALEYTVKPEPERFMSFAREGLADAKTVLVGSLHTAESLWLALGEEDGAQVELRTRLGPPGVDVERFRPMEPREAWAAMRRLQQRLERDAPALVEESSSAFTRDDQLAADALEKILDRRGVLVAYVGKLIVSKGVDLLIAAWPLVRMRAPDAQLAVVGFGAYREGLERLVACLAAGDLDGAMEIARLGRALEADGGASNDPRQAKPLRHLLAFLSSLSGVEARRYLESARGLDERIVFTGRLDHEELAEVLPACSALVVPSTFPEAFGMVAVEAGACGALPVSAAHSGLAEVSQELAGELPSEAAAWLSFPVDDDAVQALGERLVAWLGADSDLRDRTRTALVGAVRERWSWQGVARGVIAAAGGEPVGRSFG